MAQASLTLTRLEADPEMAARIVDTVMLGPDRRRLPWVAEEREATNADRASAVLASAALIASQRVATMRRNEGKTAQEKRTKEALREAGFRGAPSRTVATFPEAPGSGEFCGESLFGGRKSDLLVRLWDGRVMPIECKVSNSSTNSIKRLNNNAVKAKVWLQEFGERGVVPTAVLSGAYSSAISTTPNAWVSRCSGPMTSRRWSSGSERQEDEAPWKSTRNRGRMW